MSNPLFFLLSPLFGDSALSAAEPDVRNETRSIKECTYTHIFWVSLLSWPNLDTKIPEQVIYLCPAIVRLWFSTSLTPDWLLFPINTIIIHSLQYFMMFIIPGTCVSILITDFIYNLSLEVVCASLLCALRAIQKVHQRAPGIKISTQSSWSSWFLPPSMDEVDKSFSVRLGLEGKYKTVALQKSC